MSNNLFREKKADVEVEAQPIVHSIGHMGGNREKGNLRTLETTNICVRMYVTRFAVSFENLSVSVRRKMEQWQFPPPQSHTRYALFELVCRDDPSFLSSLLL